MLPVGSQAIFRDFVLFYFFIWLTGVQSYLFYYFKDNLSNFSEYKEKNSTSSSTDPSLSHDDLATLCIWKNKVYSNYDNSLLSFFSEYFWKQLMTIIKKAQWTLLFLANLLHLTCSELMFFSFLVKMPVLNVSFISNFRSCRWCHSTSTLEKICNWFD